MDFVLKILPHMNETELSSLLFLYAHNMWESQERFVNAETFFDPIFKHVAKEDTLRALSNQTITNILRSIGTLGYINDDTY